jgi:hypothetical protein
VINHLDQLLRDLFLGEIDEITDEDQVRFQPPDEKWQAYMSTLTVGGNPANALNVYLIELIENRKLRSNARAQSVVNGYVYADPAPDRVDCHYLISAWSPAEPSQSVEPTPDEHALLYKALAVLVNNRPLNPKNVYPPDSAALGALPELIRQTDLPSQVVPAEGFPKLAEFWGTMGNGYRWKPVVHLVVTLPVALETELSGPMVTTRITEYRMRGANGNGEIWIQIGGHVLDGTVDPALPLADAWVSLETATGEPLRTTTTNQSGRFSFLYLRSGQYQLSWRATGYAVPPPRLIDVPSPTGEYDLIFE